MNAKEGRQFVDTNIFVYAYDSSEIEEKNKRAKKLIKRLWEEETGVLSIQVLQEFLVVITKKVPKPLDPVFAAQVIEDLGTWTCHAPEVKDIIQAIRIQQQYLISYRDAMIVCSAKTLGASVIWTEDLNHGQLYEGIMAINPFLEETTDFTYDFPPEH